MIELPVEQGSPAWLEARLGIPTASELARIVTPARGQPSKQADDYADRLDAEWYLGTVDEEWSGSFWTERGHALESSARDAFRFETGLHVRSAGLVYRDEARAVACSPDGLCVNDDGETVAGLELKSPKLATHIGYAREMSATGMPTKYRMQVQGSLWITGLPRWYFASYYPGWPIALVRVEPEPAIQAALDEHMPAFLAALAGRRAAYRAQGIEPQVAVEEDATW